MRTWVLSAIGAGLSCLSANAAINSASQEILKMVQNGVSEPVLENYVNNSGAAYNLNADDIVYLQQNGVPQPVISSMLAHDKSFAQGQPYSSAPTTQYAPSQNYDYNQAPPPDQTAQVNPPDAAAYNSYNSYGAQTYSDQAVPVMQVAPDQAPPQVASFYDTLRPYGTWIYLEGYGWCWQPSVVRSSPAWQPYCDNGQWIYSSDGWYWQSSYPWGWAAFHYGRWMNASCGWVWFPDTVWAPSWVCWRDSGDYCGWAPLPPSGFSGYGRPGFHFGVGIGVGLGAAAFTFIHFGDMFHGDYHHHEISHTDVTRIYNNSRVINNVTVVNNNYARNPGISRQTVQRYTGPVQVADVRTTSANPRQSRPGVVRSGQQVTIERPQSAPTPDRTTHIVGHRLPANARSVPTTPATNANPSRQNNRNVNGSHTTSTPQPSTSSRTTSTQPSQRLQTPRTSEPSRNYNAPSQRSSTPATTESPRPNNPPVSQVPHTAPRSIQSNLSHVTQTAPTPNPRASELPTPNSHVTEVPQPNANPHVSDVPHPSQAPHVTQAPHANPTATPAPHVTQAPEVHRASPTPTVETPRAPVHEPAGAAKTPVEVPHAQPAPTPHVSTPAPHEAVVTPHVSTPPQHQQTPAPHVSAPPPHAAPQAHEVHAPPASPGHSATAPGHNPDTHDNRNHDQ